MMLGTSSSSLTCLADAAAVDAEAAEATHDSGGANGGNGEVGSGSGSIPGGFDEEKGGWIEQGERRAAGGNRWPTEETLALLKIRSEMKVEFRDSNIKGPLWEEVSRKMNELGYQRSAKKCKEKFENVYKYHKRTKEGRASKRDGKTYRFFEKLEALENNPSQLPLPPPQRRPPQHKQPQASPIDEAAAAMAMSMATGSPITSHNVTVSLPNTVSFFPKVNAPIISGQPQLQQQHPNPLSFFPRVNIRTQLFLPRFDSTPVFSVQPQLPNPFSPRVNIPIISAQPQPQPQPQERQPQPQSQPQPQPSPPANSHQSNSSASTSWMSDSTSWSTSSDEDIGRRHKRKRKFKDFFDKLMKDVMEKQEELQRKFLEKLEAWKVQEMAKVDRAFDLLAQERSVAAAKDAAVMQFLQKMTGQQQRQQNLQSPSTNAPSIPPENASSEPISVAPAINQGFSATSIARPLTQTVAEAQPSAAVPVETATRNVDTPTENDMGVRRLCQQVHQDGRKQKLMP